MNFSIEEELPIILLKEYELNSHIKHYHAYMMKWKATLGEFLKAQLEPETHLDKFGVVVKKSDIVVGHSSKEKTGRFPKYISFFLRRGNENSCTVEVTGNSKPWRWGRTPNILQTAF